MTDIGSSRLVALESGGTIQITSAIMQGSGPQGPTGPVGPPGESLYFKDPVATAAVLATISNPSINEARIAIDTGNLHVWIDAETSWRDVGRFVGPPGFVQSHGAMLTNDTLVVPVPQTDVWTTVSFTGVTFNDTEMVPGDALRSMISLPVASPYQYFNITNPVDTTYLFLAQITIDPTQALMGRARVRITRAGAEMASSSMGINGPYDIPQTLDVAWVGKAKAGQNIALEASANVGLRITSATMSVARFGGGFGPQGIQGIQGVHAFMGSPVATVGSLPANGSPGEVRYVHETGEIHAWDANAVTPAWINAGVIKGPKGDANSGFTNFNDLSGTDSTAQPVIGGAVPTTADQAIPYPNGTHGPNMPYFLRQVINKIESLLVARYSSDADRTTRRPTAVRGEVTWTDGPGTRAGMLQVHDDQLGTGTPATVPLVYWGSAPPAVGSATTAPNGTLWVQV